MCQWLRSFLHISAKYKPYAKKIYDLNNGPSWFLIVQNFLLYSAGFELFWTDPDPDPDDEYYFVKKMILKKIRTILSDLHF